MVLGPSPPGLYKCPKKIFLCCSVLIVTRSGSITQQRLVRRVLYKTMTARTCWIIRFKNNTNKTKIFNCYMLRKMSTGSHHTVQVQVVYVPGGPSRSLPGKLQHLNLLPYVWIFNRSLFFYSCMKTLQSSPEFMTVTLSGDFFTYPQGRRATARAEGKTQHLGENFKSFTK